MTRSVRLSNQGGLHLRAAAFLSQEAKKFPCTIRVHCNGRQANAKSVWDLIGLLAEHGSELLIEAVGVQSDQAIAELASIVTDRFQLFGRED